MGELFLEGNQFTYSFLNHVVKIFLNLHGQTGKYVSFKLLTVKVTFYWSSFWLHSCCSMEWSVYYTSQLMPKHKQDMCTWWYLLGSLAMLFLYWDGKREVGGGLVTAPPKSITSAFVCDISRVCCHCHMASQGSLDWFRTETVITDRNCSPSTVPTRALGLILSRTQPVTEVRGDNSHESRGRSDRTVPHDFLTCYWEKDMYLRFLGVLLLLFSCVCAYMKFKWWFCF